MSELLRVYAPDECMRSGYPFAWREINALIVEEAGSRCVRCGHPYRKGEHGRGEWSPCDEQCRHAGPIRHSANPATPDDLILMDEWPPDRNPVDGEIDEPVLTAGSFVTAGTPRVEARWRILTVHHLIDEKGDCRWWNLAPLCQRCHLTIQGRVRMAQVYPFEHSDWFKPYAAGYYAHSYLGEDLTREQTMARLDELLNLERVL